MKPAQSLAAPEEATLSGTQDDRPPSKTRRKQEMAALQQLGEELLRLNPAQLARVDLPEPLREALLEAHRITAHEGRRRQLQYIGRLMRQVDPDPIRGALADATGASHAAVALLHRCERLRDQLLEDDKALTDFLAEHPHADAQQLRALIRAARRDAATGAAPKHARQLYKWLHETLLPEHGAR
jgi:ribosome-associated protein